MARPIRTKAWGVLFGDHLEGSARFERPAILGACNAMLFSTRREARAFIDREWGYIRTRRDLRSPPHNWRMPRAVRVQMTVEML